MKQLCKQQFKTYRLRSMSCGKVTFTEVRCASVARGGANFWMRPTRKQQPYIGVVKQLMAGWKMMGKNEAKVKFSAPSPREPW